MHRKGFTLLELLIVIAILAVLATVAVLVINPVEYLKQSRDAKRIADIDTLNKALGLVDFEGISLGGASTTVFVSLLDAASSTCGTLGLPVLPAGYQYHCVTTATDLQKADGNGWIPVNFTALTAKSPIGSLPVDPINSNTQFYTYIPGGSFALSATLESDKYLKQSALNDGGPDPAKIEMGSDLKLLAKAEGLVGYWPFDEGSGTVANDMSGGGNNGTLTNGPAWTAGKVNRALSFDGVDDRVVAPFTAFGVAKPFTMSAWMKTSTTFAYEPGIISLGYSPVIVMRTDGKIKAWWYTGSTYPSIVSSKVYNDGAFHHVVLAYDGSTARLVIDGAPEGSSVSSISATFTGVEVGDEHNNGYKTFNGVIDDVRVYNRALAASEIQAIYNAGR